MSGDKIGAPDLPQAGVAQVIVSPSSADIIVGNSVQLTAQLRDASGNLVSGRSVQWSTNGAGIVSVSASGMVTGVQAGVAAVTATSEGKAGSASVSVRRVPVASVTVTPSATSLLVGLSTQLSAEVKDSAGNSLTDRTITWGTSAPAIASVSPSGVVTALNLGTAAITATSEGRTGSATVTVSDVPVASVTVTPPSATLYVGQSTQLTATARDSAGNTLSGRTAAWGTSAAGVVSVSPSGMVTAIGVGAAAVSATIEGKAGSAAVTVTQVPVASVQVAPGSAAIYVGRTVQLSATVRDSAGNALTGRTVTWGTSAPGVATVSPTGQVTGMGVGTAAVTATSEGKTGSAGITVSLAPVASVMVSPSSASVQVGSTVQFSATLRDADGNIVSGRAVAWSSNDPGVGTVSPNGLFTAVASGNATVTATSEGQSGSGLATVTGWVFVGAGDIAHSGSGDDATALILDSLVATGIPTLVFTSGDNAYEDGTMAEYLQYYDPTWGRHKAITRPSPGNHEYNTSGATDYFQYFGNLAGPAGVGYYSYDWGPWHIVSLNTNIDMTAGSIQEQWLRADLAATTKQCVLAYLHHPRFSSSNRGNNLEVTPLYQALYDYDAEVVVTGHEHHYERFAPQDPDGSLDLTRGIRQFVVGSGGRSLRGFVTPIPNSEVRYNASYGVIKLTLNDGSYTWEFIPESGYTFTDSGTGSCH